MKTTTWLAALALGSTLLSGCKDDSGLTGDDSPEPDAAPMIDAPPGGEVIEVRGDISSDTTWTSNNIYVLKEYVFVTGGTLTIQPGTTIKGDTGSALTITKDAKIRAVGTAAAPVVFTSNAAMPKSGDWGGVVLLGKGVINVAGGTNGIEGFASNLGERIRYGGTDAAHDCGKLRYARIEYAGFELSANVELNGLTLGGCGSAAEIDYVQSHLGLDDGIEVFGGSVNLKHIVISQPDDDGLDWDVGWTGKAQFVIVQQRDGRGDKGFESDNNPTVTAAMPRSNPELWNVTLIGGDSAIATKKQGGIHAKKGTAGKINNAVIAYFNNFPIDVDGAAVRDLVGSGAFAIQHTYFMKATAQAGLFAPNFDFTLDHDSMAGTPNLENDCDLSGGTTSNCFDELATFSAVTSNHMNVDAQLTDPKNLTAPSFKPAAGSPVLAGCGTPPAGFDTTATFCGAVGATDWTAGWTAYPVNHP